VLPRGAARLDRLAGHTVLLLLSLLALFPLYRLFVTALKPANAVFDGALLPRGPTLEHYAYVWRTIPIGRMLLTSFQMAALQTAGQLLTSLLAGYAFGRWTSRGDRLLLLLFVSTWLVPFQATMIPDYVLLARLGLLNTVWAVVAPQLTAAFSVLLLGQYGGVRPAAAPGDRGLRPLRPAVAARPLRGRGAGSPAARPGGRRRRRGRRSG
jgi:sn-glycerol 3-phosphate transport system permease protein